MAFNRPTIQTIIARIEEDFVANLSIISPVLRRSVARIISRVFGGASNELHGHISYLVAQIFASTADRENLIRQAALYGVTPNEATFSDGPIVITGTNGKVIPIDTSYFRDDGQEYTTDAEGTISGGSVTVNVTAVTAGIDQDTEATGTLTIGTPIADVDSVATVDTGGIDGGNDEETTDDFRDRFIQELREESLGGSDSDYIGWALEVNGVTRVFVYRHENGLGTVVVRFVRDNDPSFIPDAGEVAEVQTKLDSERPTTAEVTAAAPVEVTQPFTISITPDTTANRAAVELELDDLFFRVAEPGDGAGRGTVLLAEMRTAVGVAVADYEMTNPVTDFIPVLGEIGTRGTITWV